MSQTNDSFEDGQHLLPLSNPSRVYSAKDNNNDSCVLRYILNLDAPITFDQFSLIVRSLHSYKVQYFKTYPESNAVEVKLDYNASMKNVRAKLGELPVSVVKSNPYIASEEITELENLRSTFKFGVQFEEEEPEISNVPKKRKYKKVSRPYI